MATDLPMELLRRTLDALECGCLWAADSEAEGRMRRTTDEFRAWLIKSTAGVDVPAGWKMVPINSTMAMNAAGFAVPEAEHDPSGVYRAMLAAAPAHPAPAQDAMDAILTDAYADGRRDEQDELSSVLPGVWYMDPPDGGAPTILEQLQRQAKDAARWRVLCRNFGNERDEATKGKQHDILIRLNADGCEVLNPDGSLNFAATLATIMDDEGILQADAMLKERRS